MFKSIIAATAVCALLCGVSASAEGRYVSGSIGTQGGFDYSYGLAGTGTYQSEFKSGSQFSLAYGQKTGKSLRWELGFSGEKHDIEKASAKIGSTTFVNTITGEMKATSLDGNLYYDFPVQGPIHPYVGGGIGVTQLDLNDGFLKDGASVMRLQGMAGVSLDLGKTVALYAEARLQHIGGVEIKTANSSNSETTDLKISTSGVMGGLRVKF